MNPPYSRTIGAWMHKTHTGAEQASTAVVCLVPARTDTARWHDYAMRGQIEFLRGRLHFNRHTGSAPLPSAIVVFAARPCRWAALASRLISRPA